MSEASAFRSDIEGLRAVAVLLVVLYHAGIGPFHGGLVGVDVFFVLSGFLITSLLLRELDASGRISLPAFWGRRARRLLPASTLTVIATLVAAQWMMSPLEVRSLGHDALAAAGFVINIVFMRRNNDYFAAQASTPSALLHFWSLALEEQFYVVWPVLLALFARARNRVRVISVTVAGITIASFASSLWLTTHSPISAFYLLPTRAWELAIGALLAVAGTRTLRIPAAALRLLGWLGLAGVVVASLVIDDRTPFPGYAALLPVLATAALVLSGTVAVRHGVSSLLSVPPLQWIGKRSYAIYLWHWPAYILATARWGTLNRWQAAASMMAAVAIAAVSYSLVENPIRRDAWLAARTRRPIALGVALVVVTSGFAVAVYRQPIPSGGHQVAAPSLVVTTSGATSSTASTAPPGTVGESVATTTHATASSTSLLPPDTTTTASSTVEALLEPLLQQNRANLAASLAENWLPANLTPKLAAARNFLGAAFADGCILPGRETDLGKRSCIYGDPEGTKKIVLIGDSHAGHWFPAIEAIAKDRGWRLLVLGKLGCPPENINRFLAEQLRKDCIPWRKNVLRRLEAERPDLILVTHYRFDFRSRRVADKRLGEWESALTDYFTALNGLAEHVVFLEDTPASPNNVPICLSKNRRAIGRCAITRNAAVVPEVREAEMRAAAAAGITYLPTANWFCDEKRCSTVIGNVLVYSDWSHLTNEVALYFRPFIETVLASELGAPAT